MRSLLRALRFALPYKRFLVALALASAAYAATNALFVLLTRDAFEAALLTKDREGLRTIAILFAVVVVARGYFAYAQAYLSGYLASRVAREAQNHVMGKLVNLPLSFFHGQRAGELISRMTNDAGSLSRSVSLATELVKEPVTLIAVAAMILNLKWQLALLGFVGFPLAIWPMVALSRKIRRASQKTREKTADISSLMVQIFGGMRLVRAYGQERTEHGRFVATNEAIFKQQMRSTRAQAMGRPLVEILSSIGVAAVVLAGGELVFSGAILAQDVVAFLVALGLMYGPAKALTRANEDIQASIPGANRIFELSDARNDMPDVPDAIEIQGLREGIEFRNVTFSYVPGTPVLRDISLKIPAGRTVALVGPTGAGKSTLADLACRFYDPQQGAVTIDGLDLRRVRLRSLLDQIAIVPQEPFLFNDTIRANILYGRPGASPEELEAAARAAAIHDEIAAMPQGYDTRVGERGTLLSGGQRQRVSIARALLRNAPILILDEATSSLDSQSEQLVQQAVDRLLAGRTTLVIAHRLSTIRNADIIVVLVDGRIEDAGPHDALLARSGTYRRLWEIQQAAPAPAPG